MMTTNARAQRLGARGGFWIVDTIRRWWPVPVLGLLLGALAAGVAAPQASPSSTATLRLQVDAADSQAMARQAQSILTETEASSVMEDAAATLGVDAADLRQRTSLAVPTESLILTVRTRAESPEEAAAAANAVAGAIVAADAKRLGEQLAEVSRTTSDLIRNSPMPDPTADRARINRLAEGMAEAQSQLISQSKRVSLLQRAVATPTAGSSRTGFVLMGALGGTLAATGVVLYLGVRRGRVRSGEELHRLFPATDVLSTATLLEMVSSDPALDTVVVVAGDAAGAQAALLSIQAALSRIGIETTVAASGSNGRTSTLAAAARGGPRVVTLVAVVGTAGVLRRYANEASVLVVHPVTLGRTRVEDIDSLARAFPSVCFVVMEGGSDGRTSDGATEGTRHTAKVP